MPRRRRTGSQSAEDFGRFTEKLGLHHGLQDQYWDLEGWLLEGMANGLNDDELFARQAVVEGEATYAMAWWAIERQTGRPPSPWTTFPRY